MVSLRITHRIRDDDAQKAATMSSGAITKRQRRREKVSQKDLLFNIDLLSAGKIRPIIDRRLPFERDSRGPPAS
jgi:NADPH:quinone reductase-like Zn-dependent oxidoreductase